MSLFQIKDKGDLPHTIMGILGLNSLMGTFGEAVVDQHLSNNHSAKRKSRSYSTSVVVNLQTVKGTNCL